LVEYEDEDEDVEEEEMILMTDEDGEVTLEFLSDVEEDPDAEIDE
jgi:hypothetical protein